MADAPVVVTTTYATAPKDALRAYRASHPIAYGLRCLAAAVLVAAGMVRGDLTGIVLGVALYAVGEFSVRRQLQPSLQRTVTGTMTATEDGYELVSDLGEVRRPWTAFRSVRRTRRFWVLQLNRVAALALPVSALDADQTEAFEALLRRRGLR